MAIKAQDHTINLVAQISGYERYIKPKPKNPTIVRLFA
jgi:hypothetical protein